MKKVYLNTASTALFSPGVLACADTFTAIFSNPDLTAADISRRLRDVLADARKAVARYLLCDAAEIALVESATHALGIISLVLPLERRHNILCCDLEYQSSVLCWRQRQKKTGFSIREVKTVGGEITAEDFLRHADADTKAIILAPVQEINGYRADVKTIAAMARERGILLILDGIQEVGAMRVDLSDLDVDVYCAGGKKWLGNPFGCGFLYVNKRLLHELDPPFDGYFKISMDTQYRDYLAYLEDPGRSPFDPCEPLETAAKFENGGFANYLGAMGLAEAVREHEAIGAEVIESSILDMQEYLLRGVLDLGMAVCGPHERARMSSTLSCNFGLAEGAAREKRLVGYLESRNIFTSLRCSTGTGGVRVSPHHYNSFADIDAFLEGVRDFIRAGSSV